MTSIERRRLWYTSLFGLGLTALVLGAALVGLLTPLEHWLYHRRARYCQFFTPAPDDSLIHLDIDDSALDIIGSWPWPRSYLAEILDELNLAGTRAVAMDVIFSEPQQPRYQLTGDGKPGRLIDDDEAFAESIRQFDRVMIPFSTELIPRAADAVTEAMQHVLRNNLEMTVPQAMAEIRRLGYSPQQIGEDFESRYVAARRAAMFERINATLTRSPGMDRGELIAHLLPAADPKVTTPIVRVLDRQLRRVRAMQQLLQFSQPLRADLPALIQGHDDLPPIMEIASAVTTSGYVSYLPFSDGIVRAIPLWLADRGRMYPQFALSLACLTLGVDVRNVVITPNSVHIPRPGREDLVIPTRTHYVSALGKTYGGFIEIPWFGPAEHWQLMYDWPNYREPKRHIPLSVVWQVIESRHRIAQNLAMIDDGIRGIYELMAPEKLDDYVKNPPPPDDFAARARRVKLIMPDAELWLKGFDEMSPDELAAYMKDLPDDGERQKYKVFLASARTLPKLVDATAAIVNDLDVQRQKVRVIFEDKTALIGWTATAAIADFVPTSLHAKCPGVVVHGVIYNGIMTGDLWRPTAAWFDPTVVIGLGLMTTIIVGGMSPLWGTIGAIGLAAGWSAFNGIVLFDYGNLISQAGAPLATIALVWAGCTMLRFISERAERARITRRFRSYVDPALVNFVIDHPENTTLSGAERELTVVFTDLAGFTTVSEKLGRETIGIINEYMGLMVPLIRRHQGYVNKFLGDGIMFFYGAPRDNEHHALDAVRTILLMQRTLADFNKRLVARDLPAVKMRAGVATGSMIVGDAGPPDASDYTVLGDTVNLAARLESANKATGTLMMLNERTVEQLNDRYLVRPLGRLQVVGKTEGVMVYEPLAERDVATDDQRRFVQMTTAVFEAYCDGDFDACRRAAEALDEAFGPSKLTALYHDSCDFFEKHDRADFAGQIVLSSK